MTEQTNDDVIFSDEIPVFDPTDSEYEGQGVDLQSLLEQHEGLVQRLSDSLESMIQDGYITRQSASSLRQLTQGIPSMEAFFEGSPMNSYTDTPSLVNYNETMESVVASVLAALWKAIKLIIKGLIDLGKWLLNFVTGNRKKTKELHVAEVRARPVIEKVEYSTLAVSLADESKLTARVNDFASLKWNFHCYALLDKSSVYLGQGRFIKLDLYAMESKLFNVAADQFIQEVAANVTADKSRIGLANYKGLVHNLGTKCPNIIEGGQSTLAKSVLSGIFSETPSTALNMLSSNLNFAAANGVTTTSGISNKTPEPFENFAKSSRTYTAIITQHSLDVLIQNQTEDEKFVSSCVGVIDKLKKWIDSNSITKHEDLALVKSTLSVVQALLHFKECLIKIEASTLRARSTLLEYYIERAKIISGKA